MVRNPGIADLLTDVDQILSQVAQPLTFRDLFESLRDRVRWNHKGNGLTFLPMSQKPRGPMPRFAGLGAMAIRFTALAEATGQTARPQIARSGIPGFDAFTLNHQFGYGSFGH